jgi:hypothetical protein
MSGHDPKLITVAAKIAVHMINEMEVACNGPIKRDELSVLVATIVIDALAASLVTNVHLLPESLRPSDEFIAACASIGAAKGKGDAS